MVVSVMLLVCVRLRLRLVALGGVRVKVVAPVAVLPASDDVEVESDLPVGAGRQVVQVLAEDDFLERKFSLSLHLLAVWTYKLPKNAPVV